jgi:hypothetical protein
VLTRNAAGAAVGGAVLVLRHVVSFRGTGRPLSPHGASS